VSLCAMWSLICAPESVAETEPCQEVRGTVRSSDGARLPGVTVSVSGTRISAVTDDSGDYALTGLSVGQVVLVASLSGFASSQTTVTLARA
jgi:hypothetical protein